MGSSNRGTVPAPLSMDKTSYCSTTTTTSPTTSSPQSPDSNNGYFEYTSMTSPGPNQSWDRSDSPSAMPRTYTNGLSPTSYHKNSSSRKNSKSSKVNAHSYCGRHTDEFLFNGLDKLTHNVWNKLTKKE